MNGPVLDPDKEESTMEALGMIETKGLVGSIEAAWFVVMLQPVKPRPMQVPQRHSVSASWYLYTLSRVRTATWKKSSRSA